MANLIINLNIQTTLASNKFFCQILDANGSTIDFFAQNQQRDASATSGLVQLVYNLPDGNYLYNGVIVRLYNGSLTSGVWSDIISDIAINCSTSTTTTITTTQNNTTTTTNNQSTTTTVPITTTTVGTTTTSTTTIQQNCVEPSSVVINGTTNVNTGSTHSYTFTKVGGVNNSIIWTVNGGTIIGSNTGATVQIQWGSQTGLKSVSVSVGCTGGSNPAIGFLLVTIGTGNTTTNTTVNGNFDYFPINDSPRPANGKVRIEGTNSVYELWLNYGGAISYAAKKTNGVVGNTIINTYDAGRLVGYGVRSLRIPTDFSQWQVVPVWNTDIYNPNEGGNWKDVGSPVLNYGYDSNTDTHYIKTRFVDFAIGAGPNGIPYYITGVFQEQWVKLMVINGIEVLRTIRRVTNDRNLDHFAEQIQYSANYQQEWPFVHTNPQTGYKFMQFVTQNNIQTVDISITDTSTKLLSENWWYVGNNAGEGLGIVGPEIWEVAGRPLDSGAGFVCYSVNNIMNNVDYLGVIYGQFDLIVGDVNTVRQHYQNYTGSRTGLAPSVDFRNVNKRYKIASQNAKLNLEDTQTTQGKLVVTHLTKQPYLRLPRELFNASSVTKYYVKMRLAGANANSAPTTLRFNWDKPNQVSIDTVTQNINFTISQSMQIIEINVAANSSWNGVISRINIEQDGPEFTPVTNTDWEIEYISPFNLG
jgi:hypothetical protein